MIGKEKGKDGRRRLTDNEILDICELYQAGESRIGLATRFHVTPPTIDRWLSRNEIKTRDHRKLLDKDIEEICSLYKSCRNAAEIARRFSVDSKTIHYHLHKHNIATSRYTYSIGQPGFFREIDTERKAYWVGLIAADGCVIERNNTLQMGFLASDRVLLEKFLQDIEANHPIHKKDKGRYVRIDITAPSLIKDLRQFGIIPRKTFNLVWPNMIPEPLISHYMRGFVDGDGGFYFYKSKLGYAPKFSFALSSGCVQFLTKFRDELALACEIPPAKIFKQKGHNTRMFSYCGRFRVRDIFQFLYRDATVWLPRKRNRVEPYLRCIDSRQLKLTL